MDYEKIRLKMVSEQIIERGITDDRVIEAMKKVPRHEFVSEALADRAYEDHPLPIGEGQTISQPYMVAIMTQELKLTGNEKVLEIGTGSGYQAAILAELAKTVYTVERLETLVKKAQQLLVMKLGYINIIVVKGNGTVGLKEYQPYDRIIVTAAAPSIPEELINQLNIGGRLVIPVGSRYSQTLTIVKKTEKKVEIEESIGCIFVPLIGKYGWK